MGISLATGTGSGGGGACAEATSPDQAMLARISATIVVLAETGLLPGRGGGVIGRGLRGKCQSRRSDGTTSCQRKNAIRTVRNAHAPLGQRRVAQERSVHPITAQVRLWTSQPY